MTTIEKILQEIEEMKYPIDGIGCGLEDAGITDRYESAEYGWNEAADMAYDVVKNHLSDTENEGWILVEDGLPEERNSMFAKWKGTDKWSESMFEKISSDVNVTVEYEDGSPAIGGCAMTKEYTTVFHELLTDTYIIFFGERICYKVTNANAEFYEDLQKRNMASLSEAKRRY